MYPDEALPCCLQYAQWEEGQKDFRRARSVWERALEVTYTNPTTWLKYAEMEMRHRFVNHARNVWDRAVSLLPRVDQLWYKYIHMEEMLGNVPGARQIFERWMGFEPDHHGWMAFIKVAPSSVCRPPLSVCSPSKPGAQVFRHDKPRRFCLEK